MKRLLTLLSAMAAVAAATTLAGTATADDTIRTPGAHLKYALEGEVHGLWGWTDYADGGGLGIGGRISVPIVDNGFVPSINNSVAISAGLDWLSYGGPGCYHFNGTCYGAGSADYIFIPVVMQWNFYVAKRWSVFGEPGVAIYHLFYSNPCDGIAGCNYPGPTVTSLTPVFYAGARYQITDHLAVVMRVGYPTISVGVSFM